MRISKAKRLIHLALRLFKTRKATVWRTLWLQVILPTLDFQLLACGTLSAAQIRKIESIQIYLTHFIEECKEQYQKQPQVNTNTKPEKSETEAEESILEDKDFDDEEKIEEMSNASIHTEDTDSIFRKECKPYSER